MINKTEYFPVNFQWLHIPWKRAFHGSVHTPRSILFQWCIEFQKEYIGFVSALFGYLSI
jgi:hypothetical protein